MGRISRLLVYLKKYKAYVGLNILSNLLMAVFTVVSVPAIIPFLQILFEKTPVVPDPVEWEWSLDGVVAFFQYRFAFMVQEQGVSNALFYVCIGIILLFFLKNLFKYLSLFFMAPVRNGIVRDIRSALFARITVLPLAFFSEERKGDILSRVSSDVQEVEWSILNVLEVIFRAPIIIIGCLLLMLYISPSLTLFILVLLGLTAVIIGGISRTLKRQSGEIQSKLGRLISMVDETLGGLRVIKGFNAGAYQRGKFDQENDSYKNLLVRLFRRKDLSSPLSEFLGIVVVAILLWYGSSEVFRGQLEAETFFAFIFAFYNVIEPAKSFSSAFYNIQKGLGAVDRIDEILEADISLPVQASPIPFAGFKDSIDYRGVSFSYSEIEEKVLHKVSFSVKAGKMVALVGASGAGKSTLVDLLPRFYDVSEGGIFIDGVDIRKISLENLRSLMGIVTQEPVLFHDSVAQNISFGNHASLEEIKTAAKIANAHDFILGLKDGYNTIIGDRGHKLSGGQRQRLTIARAVLKNPAILILDEATSALDSESEKLVQEALFKLMKDRTSLVIAHRLSTILHADEILVMDRGEIIQRGTHLELMKDTDGAYAKMVVLQGI